MEQSKTEGKKLSREELLGKGRIPDLLLKFAVPSSIAMLVAAVYNIVDQIFIGHYVGTLGNAATNIAFPLTMSCLAIGLLFGVGGAANFNLCMGRKEYEKAPYFIGNSVSMLLILGTLLTVVTELFLRPMMLFFGSPEDVLPYAIEYVRITAIGFPFLILTTGGGHVIRADGSPNMTMICSLTGAIINTVLDALFVVVFHWGMFGAALATVIGQVISGAMVLWYLRDFKTVPLLRKHFVPNAAIAKRAASLGTASATNQVAMMAMQIILNNSLKHYGGLSVYGAAIPIACAGIAGKVNQLSFSIVIGIAQGSQPIESFNYGAKQYPRVKQTYLLAVKAAFAVSVLSFVLYQTIPETLLGIFGTGAPEYVAFGVKFFRVFLFCTWANCVQPPTAQFFASVGKPLRGTFVSLTRQILFLVPLLLILPLFFGIEGILYAGPVADFLAMATALYMIRIEYKEMTRLEAELKTNSIG